MAELRNLRLYSNCIVDTVKQQQRGYEKEGTIKTNAGFIPTRI
jgi:hypothetical protein